MNTLTPEEAKRILAALTKHGITTEQSDGFLRSEQLRRELTNRIAAALKDDAYGPGSSMYALLFPAIAISLIMARGQRGEARDNLGDVLDRGFDAVEDAFRRDPDLKRALEYYQRSGEDKDANKAFAAFAESKVL